MLPDVRRPAAPPADDAAAARARIAGLGTRPAWVPRPPAGAAGGARQPVENAPGKVMRHARRRPRVGYRVAAAVADRLPLVLRSALVRGRARAAAPRDGRAGMDGGHVAVIALLALVGIAGSGLVAMAARPDVVEVGPPRAPEVLATGTPATGAGGRPVPGAGAPPVTASPSPRSAAADRAGGLLVHVAGRVGKPGVVRLPPGARVADALAAAGGPLPGVDLTPLNLARPLSDGEQVLVGLDAAAGAPPPPTSGPGAGSGGAGAPPAAAGAPLDLNTATAEQLDGLPGVGPVLAERILAWRQEHGRFTAVEELQEVRGIGPRTFEDLADRVRV